MSQPYGLDYSSKFITSQQQQQEMYAQKNSVDCDDADLKGSSNYEALFDSGYNSNVQSKTFLDESDLESMQSSKIDERDDQDSKNSKTNISAQQLWSDSGVCITDSGLSITEDDSFAEPSQTSETDIQSSTVVESDLPRKWLKQNSEGDT